MLDEGHGRLRADNGRKRAENGPKRDEGATESCGPGSRLYVGFVSFVPVRSPLFRAGQHSITCDSAQSASPAACPHGVEPARISAIASWAACALASGRPLPFIRIEKASAWRLVLVT